MKKEKQETGLMLENGRVLTDDELEEELKSLKGGFHE